MVLTRVIKLTNAGELAKVDVKDNKLGIPVRRYQKYPYAPTMNLAVKVVEVLREVWRTNVDTDDI